MPLPALPRCLGDDAPPARPGVGAAPWLLALTCWVGAGCQAPEPAADHPPHAHLADHLAVTSLLGTWKWAHVVDDPGLRRLETETWQFWPDPTLPELGALGARLRGRYLREVTVRSAGAPFACNQAAVYRQRATFELVAVALGGRLEIIETDYQAQPSPCDHGVRRLGTYRAKVRRGRALLDFDQGRQTLWRVDDASPSPPLPPWPQEPEPFAGRWTWTHRALDDRGLWQDEEERWDFTGPAATTAAAELHDEQTFAAVYARRVTVSSPDGSELACAGAPAYAFEDRYLIEGKRKDGLLILRETAVAAAEHPCLTDRATRALDTATVEPLGEHLVLQWRGKRQQVLRRER